MPRRAPSNLLLYQRAQDALLAEATPIAAARLAQQGYRGELGLLKNCRDADGHWYGAQENYELDIARGAGLAVWRAGLAALLPVALAGAVATWALMIALIAIVLVGGAVVLVATFALGARRRAAVRRLHGPAPRAIG